MSIGKLFLKIVAGIAVVVLSWNSNVLAQDEEKGPPLPFHTIEGYGGGGITPMAYLVNPGQEGCFWGKPAAGVTVLNAGQKNLDAITATETLFQRVELGFAADRLGLGTLPSDLDQNGVDITNSSVWLYNLNVRTLLVKEDTCLGGLALPAITFGVQLKANDGIESLAHQLADQGVYLQDIGYRRSNGEDFTLTATKNFAKLVGRPLFLTVGLRESEAAQIGFLGFGDTYRATVEANVVFLPTDWLVLGYEFRQKKDPYALFPNSAQGGYLIGPENNWSAFDASLIVNKHTTLVAGWGLLGNLVNARADNAWFLQFKYEF